MDHRKNVSNEDLRLFRDAIGDVRRLNSECHSGNTPHPRPIPIPRRQCDERAVIDGTLSNPSASEVLETGDHLSYRANGVQVRVLQKLRRGSFTVRGELDLHGLNVEQAREQVRDFLRYALDGGLHCVRIIHGKGYKRAERAPVLKPMLNHWLRCEQEVIAFCSARSNDGGTGAVYVLLRRTY